MSGDTSTCGMHLDGAFRLMNQARTWKTNYSSKARSLHRIYFYLRAIYESTQVRGSSDVPLALRTSDVSMPEVTRWPQSDVMHIMGETDRSGHPNSSSESPTLMTTYEYIYGVPRSLLVLLWECIRLIQDLTAVREKTRSPMIPADLVDRCDELERCIMDWSTDLELERRRNEQSSARSEIIYHTTLAFHNALIIYFAQDVRSMGHRYLQPYVQAVLDNIEAIERIKAEVHILAAPLYWPAFIAASEAFHDHLQERFRTWYNHVEMYGIAAVRTGTTVLAEVWNFGPRRENALSSQWRTVVKRTNVTLMLS
jgi:arginine metabolism regulation protein II